MSFAGPVFPRGLKDVFLIVSDAHQGLRNAADRHFQGVI
ncbi:MAG: transposase [Deltaproteobacteria bacterium]|nr:transposase [Deltaproteobacteria bacterium]